MGIHVYWLDCLICNLQGKLHWFVYVSIVGDLCFVLQTQHYLLNVSCVRMFSVEIFSSCTVLGPSQSTEASLIETAACNYTVFRHGDHTVKETSLKALAVL